MKKFRIFGISLSIIFFISNIFSIPVYADEINDEESLSVVENKEAYDEGDSYYYSINLPEDAFDGPSAVFDSKDGSKTTVYDNGSVSTEYSDGSKESIDNEGNRYSLDVNGNKTIYLKDGNIIKGLNDGTMTMQYVSGKQETFYTDGSVDTMYKSGLCNRVNPDGSSYYYFPGGEGTLVNDGSGYTNGTITGPNGEVFTTTDNGFSLITKDKDNFKYKSNEDGLPEIEMQFSDGCHLQTFKDGKVEMSSDEYKSITDSNGNTFVNFVDGTTFSLNSDGLSTIQNPDGSYYKLNSNTNYCEVYNSSNNAYMKVNDDGSLDSLHIEGNGVLLDVTNGQINKMEDYNQNFFYNVNADGVVEVSINGQNYIKDSLTDNYIELAKSYNYSNEDINDSDYDSNYNEDYSTDSFDDTNPFSDREIEIVDSIDIDVNKEVEINAIENKYDIDLSIGNVVGSYNFTDGEQVVVYRFTQNGNSLDIEAIGDPEIYTGSYDDESGIFRVFDEGTELRVNFYINENNIEAKMVLYSEDTPIYTVYGKKK